MERILVWNGKNPFLEREESLSGTGRILVWHEKEFWSGTERILVWNGKNHCLAVWQKRSGWKYKVPNTENQFHIEIEISCRD
jgi:hypothetical protein